MLQLEVQGVELFDDSKQEFVTSETVTISLEHSLVALSSWESKWEKPFLSSEKKTSEETISYIRLMSVDGEIPEEVVLRLSEDQSRQINEYIESKMSATWFSNQGIAKTSREIITAEIIYHLMIALNIPKECEYWHLSRLFTLIRVIDEKNKPAKKMSASELAARNRALNEQRLAAMKTRG